MRSFPRNIRVGIGVLESILPEPKTQNLVLLGLISNPLVQHREATRRRSDLRSATLATGSTREGEVELGVIYEGFLITYTSATMGTEFSQEDVLSNTIKRCTQVEHAYL